MQAARAGGASVVTDDRANIKIDRGTFEKLQEDKPRGVTWAYYLTQSCLVE